MIRIDVFRRVIKSKKKLALEHYIVPVYAHQFSGKALPNRAIVSKKSEEEWTVISAEHEFLFSVYPNDLLELDDGKGQKTLGYYVSTDRGDGRISIASPEQSNDDAKRIGSKTLKSIRKYEVDALGNRREILPGTEKRRGMENRSHRKRSAPSV
jgi:CRISPR-associated endonuclease Csn1